MEYNAETDYFKLLEDKIGELIIKIQDMKDERASFTKTIDDQKVRIDTLTMELDELKGLRESKQQAKERITTIIEKLDKLAV